VAAELAERARSPEVDPQQPCRLVHANGRAAVLVAVEGVHRGRHGNILAEGAAPPLPATVHTMELHEALAARVQSWREASYPHDTITAIAEILVVDPP
jgi:hypothetical protein